MGIKEFIKRKKEEWKEKAEREKELYRIKNEAYQEEMKKQNRIMGMKQAQIEAEFREKKFRDKINKKQEAKDNPKEKVDYFGLGNKDSNKEVDHFGLKRDFPGYT